MASTPSAKKKTSPIVWVGLAALAFAAYSFLGSDEPPAVASTTKKKPANSKNSTLYTPEDATAKFASYTPGAVDVFNPLIKKQEKPVTPPDPLGTKGMDLRLTGGEPNWFYTGVVQLNGATQALLENTTSGESIYVSPGEAWKAARIKSIDVSSVVMVAPDGSDIRVAIQEYGLAPGASPVVAKDVAQPLSPSGAAITGAIGAGAPGNIAVRPVAGTATMTLPDGRTIQVPLDPTAAAASSNNNQGGGRRRGRRNRNNNNSGDFNAP